MRQEPEWITDDVRNLSQKKMVAWIHLCNNRTSSLAEEYKRLCKMIKEAANKARNAWWNARAEEAERRAAVAECLGRGGSLIRELRLLSRSVAKASSTTLHALDGTALTSD